MLDKIVTTMDAIYEQMEQIKSADTRGDVYEYLLSKLATAGVNGQFRTPRHIIRMMVEMMDLRQMKSSVIRRAVRLVFWLPQVNT